MKGLPKTIVCNRNLRKSYITFESYSVLFKYCYTKR